jgi:ADP-heptose:LPS heptosyltransferase
MARALYICQNAIGDIITSLPSVHFLKGLPSHRLDVLVSDGFDDLFSADPHVDGVIRIPQAWYEESAATAALTLDDLHSLGLGERYDVVIDSMSVPASARLIRLLEPCSSIGISFDPALHIHEHEVPLDAWKTWSTGDRNACDCFADVIRCYREDYVDTEPILYVASWATRWASEWIAQRNPSRLPIVALNPGAGSYLKQWPFERYLALGAWLKETGWLPLFVFGPKEADLCANSERQILDLGAIGYSSSSPRIQEVAALLKQCALTITNDCAVMHISASVGTRTLAIFGPTHSKIWFPYRRPWNQVVERLADCRANCISGCEERHCLDRISLEEVVDRALPMLPKLARIER